MPLMPLFWLQCCLCSKGEASIKEFLANQVRSRHAPHPASSAVMRVHKSDALINREEWKAVLTHELVLQTLRV